MTKASLYRENYNSIQSEVVELLSTLQTLPDSPPPHRHPAS